MKVLIFFALVGFAFAVEMKEVSSHWKYFDFITYYAFKWQFADARETNNLGRTLVEQAKLQLMTLPSMIFSTRILSVWFAVMAQVLLSFRLNLSRSRSSQVWSTKSLARSRRVARRLTALFPYGIARGWTMPTRKRKSRPNAVLKLPSPRVMTAPGKKSHKNFKVLYFQKEMNKKSLR